MVHAKLQQVAVVKFTRQAAPRIHSASLKIALNTLAQRLLEEGPAPLLTCACQARLAPTLYVLAQQVTAVITLPLLASRPALVLTVFACFSQT